MYAKCISEYEVPIKGNKKVKLTQVPIKLRAECVHSDFAIEFAFGYILYHISVMESCTTFTTNYSLKRVHDRNVYVILVFIYIRRENASFKCRYKGSC